MLDKYARLHKMDLLLITAAELGLYNQVLMYVKSGANINVCVYLNAKTKGYLNPIHFAALSGNLACVQWLVKKGAKFLPRKPVKYLTSPLHYAAAGGSEACIQYFLSRGVPINLVSIICPRGEYLTPVQIAVAYNHVNCYRLLVSKGANIHFRDPDGTYFGCQR